MATPSNVRSPSAAPAGYMLVRSPSHGELKGPPASSRTIAPSSATHDEAESSESKTTPYICQPGTTLPSVGEPVPLTIPVLLRERRAGGRGTFSVPSSMKKETRYSLAASYQLATNGSGFMNAQVSNDMVSALTEFSSFAELYDEFFISKMELMYQPASRYQKTQVGTSYIDFPLHLVSREHGQANYLTHTSASTNSALAIANSADPWKYTWRNSEKRKSGVLIASSTTSTIPSQGWCLTDAAPAQLYTGRVQVISPSAITGPVAFLFGTITVRWEVYFRCRE